MLQGPSFELYGEILEQANVGLIASGGVTTMDDLYKRKDMGCGGGLIGKGV